MTHDFTVTALEALRPAFHLVCGQNLDHQWAPGGLALPCCQRCTGLYVGALLALALHLVFRPRAGRRFVQVHALFLFQLVVLGFPGFPSGPVLRTVSGLLYGFGALTFLYAAVRQTGSGPDHPVASKHYIIALATSLALTPAIAQWGGAAGACLLASLVLAGAISLAALLLINLALALASCFRLLGHTVRLMAAPPRSSL